MKNNESFENDPVVNKVRQDSNFRALKVLVQTENTIRTAQNRIKVLEANQNKSVQKIHLQLGTIEKIQKARQKEQMHNQMIEEVKKEIEKHNAETSEKNKIMKSQHLMKIDQVVKEINEEKKVQYLQTQECSENAEKSIIEAKNKDHKQKEEKRLKVNKEEQIAKINQIKFHEMRQSHIKENKIQELSSLKIKETKKQKQLRKLGAIEMELIQKQSQSQAAYLEVKNKLDSLLHSVKQQHNQSKQSLKASVHISPHYHKG